MYTSYESGFNYYNNVLIKLFHVQTPEKLLDINLMSFIKDKRALLGTHKPMYLDRNHLMKPILDMLIFPLYGLKCNTLNTKAFNQTG